MDFGFHPTYVLILLALALIVFGPSRLPKMGAQVGRMLREFQDARDGLTQQMRDAFQEEPETDFAGSTVPVEEDAEPAVEVDSPVAVLDPPPEGQTTPEAMGTAEEGAAEGPWEGFSGTTPAEAEGEAESKAESPALPGTDSVAPPVTKSDVEAPAGEAGNPFAWAGAEHEGTPAGPQDEEPRGA